MGPQLTFDEGSHTYRVDGRVVPSVTQIIGSVFPNVYANIPPAVLERKAKLGTAVHKAIELFLLDRLDASSVHPEVEPYLESWLSWWSCAPLTLHLTEGQFFSASGGYAGTIDFVGHAGWSATKTVIDWKITTTKVPTHAVQSAAYAAAVGADRAGCLYLKSDGSIGEFVQTDLAVAAADWMATLRVYNMQRKFNGQR